MPQSRCHRSEPCEVPTRMGETLRVSQGDRVGQDYTYDRNRVGDFPHGVDRGGTSYHNDIDLEVYELSGERLISVRVAFRPAILDHHGLALDPAQFVQTF